MYDIEWLICLTGRRARPGGRGTVASVMKREQEAVMGKRSELTPFGRQVKIRLLERGMDAAELARRVGTSPVQISRILHGKRPGREQIPKIASELGIELDENQRDA